MDDDNASAGRNQEMVRGAESVREPQFHTAQRVRPGYYKTSVYDQLRPSQNGLAEEDLQRQMFGVRSLQNTETADKNIWLRNPTNPSLYNTFG